MNILHRFKKPDMKKSLDQGAILEIHLDESAIRMSLLYEINPAEFMIKALRDEIHVRAITREASYFEERRSIQPIFTPRGDPK